MGHRLPVARKWFILVGFDKPLGETNFLIGVTANVFPHSRPGEHANPYWTLESCTLCISPREEPSVQRWYNVGALGRDGGMGMVLQKVLQTASEAQEQR